MEADLVRKNSLIAIISISLALSTALILHVVSSDYSFTPRPLIVEKDDTVVPREFIPPEELAKHVRSTGTTEPGNVEVQALFLNLIMDTDDENLVFQLAFNTHSVNLADYDIAEEVYLENSKGMQIKKDFTWNVTQKDSAHHIMGFLTVPDRSNGEPFLSDDTEWIKLVLKRIPTIEKREFQWRVIS